MLDVHPPHAATHTWKDFFIHLATITIGLLIAISLEQTVEYLHHRHQVAETREALRLERETNIDAYARSVDEFRRQNAALKNNLFILDFLKQHPGTPQAQLPGILVWHAIRGNYSDSAWKTAQQSNVTEFMPQDEVRKYARLYSRIDNAAKIFDYVWPAIVRARLYSITDPDPAHLSPAQLEEEISYTKEVLAQNFTHAAALVQLGYTDTGFKGLSKDELNGMMRITETEADPSLAKAIAATNSRLPPDAQLPVPQPESPK